MIVDLDHFKNVNDRYGHAVGDQCLVAVAERLRALCESSDELPARLGGEEFAVILPRSDRDVAYALAETFRADMAQRAFVFDAADVALAVSVGVGEFRADAHADADALYRDVDSALYRAKNEGRNRVCLTTANSHVAARRL